MLPFKSLGSVRIVDNEDIYNVNKKDFYFK